MPKSEATVVGSGAGALAIAADMTLQGVDVTLCDLPRFRANLDAISTLGGIRARIRQSLAEEFPEPTVVPIAGCSDDPASAVAGGSLTVVCVPAFGHRAFANELGRSAGDGQTIIWAGEGGGAMVAVAEARRSPESAHVVHAELNTLPYVARLDGPGAVSATRKKGGTLIAALPAAETARVAAVAKAVWPWIRPAGSVWETVLTNFNAVDHVATFLCNLGRFETPGTFKPWGECATPGVVRVIIAVDDEYRSLRQALGVDHATRWDQYMVEQGMATVGADAYETLHHGVLAGIEFQGGPDALGHRFLTEDVPYSLVLASDVGAAVGVPTPVVDGLIHIACAATGQDYKASGRTLGELGLGDRDAAGLRRAAQEGRW